MPVHHGNEGSVYLGAAQIAQVQGITYNEQVNVLAYSNMGDSALSYISDNLKQGSGTIECFWDETDATGQTLLTTGAQVVINAYFEGNTTGDVYRTGTVTIESVNYNASKDGIITSSYTFQGVMSESTVV